MKRTLHKALSMLLTAAMVLNMGLTPVFAVGVAIGASGLTDCHTAHDGECGYSETIQTGGCTHEHDGDCGFTEGAAEQPCTFIADEDVEASPADATETADTTETADAEHSHDEACGYAPATEGTPCEHEHDDTCGYGETVSVTSPCAHTCEVCDVMDSDKPAEKVCTCGAVDSGEPVHGEDCPLYTAPERSEAVKTLIALVDALPNAADITEENKEATIPAFEAAAMAYGELSDEDKAAFEKTEQYTKLMALREVLFAVTQLADSPLTLNITGADNYIDISAAGYKLGTAALIPYTGAYILTGNTTSTKAPDSGGYKFTHISVSGGTHNITLNNVNIDVSQSNYEGAFVISEATVNLTLTGENTLKSGTGNAGLQVLSNSNLTISGDGSLTAIGKGGAAGIGGGRGGSSGIVTINGGVITATGSNIDTTKGGAGIGGGNASDGGTTIIIGGKVTATGGPNAAGIGGGSTQGNSGSITIEKDAVVYATKGTGTGAQSHIGAGDAGEAGSINLTGGIIFEGNAGTMKSDVTLESYITVTIGQGQTLNMPADNDLAVPVGAKIINNGTLTVSNTITGSGTYEGSGTLSVALKQYMIKPPANLAYTARQRQSPWSCLTTSLLQSPTTP